ncbi:MAG: cupin domain-containing protein [Planctomycetota bacterium]|nr:cupin domain-containing protein [Planctomycetota bacterium]
MNANSNAATRRSNFFIKLFSILVLAQIFVGCASNGVVTTSDKREVTVLRQQVLAEQIASGREVVVTLVETPPNTVGEWHWHPSETYHYYLEGSVTIEFKDGTKLEGVPGPVNHVPYGAWHRGVTGDRGVRLIVFRVHQEGEPIRHLEEQHSH